MGGAILAAVDEKWQRTTWKGTEEAVLLLGPRLKLWMAAEKRRGDGDTRGVASIEELVAV